MKKKTTDTFLKEAKEKNDKITVIGEYVDCTTKILVCCNECGYQYYTKPGVVLNGHGCPKCSGNVGISHEEFLQRMETINPNIEINGLYEKQANKIPVKCKICGYVWTPTAGSLLSGHGCPRCVGKARIKPDEFVQRIALRNPKVELLGIYHSLKEPVLVRCRTCGFEWMANPKNLLNGSGCGICASNKRKTNDEFLEELAMKAPNIEALSDYQNARKKIKVRCRICGFEWLSEPHNLLRGYGCPICVLAGTSRVERFIYECFCSIFGKENVLSRDMSTIGVELDIVVPQHKIAIEYGAWHWHKDKLENDIVKRKECLNKGIRLITIYDAITEPSPFMTDCYCFSEALSINSLSALTNLVTNLFNDIGIDINGKIDFDDIKKSVMFSSGVNKLLEFIRNVEMVNPNIEVIGSYINANTPITVRCKQCGYEWNASPSNLKNGSGCPRCKRKLKKTNEQFIQELFEVNSCVEPLEEYVGAHTKIKVRCEKCGREWFSSPNTLLRGNGCRICARLIKKIQVE